MEAKNREGLIFKIDRFCLHDGPGIRTVVFLKGCPLRCLWCSNPESQEPYPEILVRDELCSGCGGCGEICPQGAISFEQGRRKIDRSKCDDCLKCADACPTGAIGVVGLDMTVNQVMAEVKSDEHFYRNSGGGLTVSGGEPLMQWRFVRDLLRECKDEGIHTAIETSGYGEQDIVSKVLRNLDMVLFDVKHLQASHHKRGTGKDNKLILQNLRLISERVRVWLRFPIVPGYNDSEENINNLIELAGEIGAERVSLLPYHPYGIVKYEQLGRRYQLKELTSPGEDVVLAIQKRFENAGITAAIGC